MPAYEYWNKPLNKAKTGLSILVDSGWMFRQHLWQITYKSMITVSVLQQVLTFWLAIVKAKVGNKQVSMSILFHKYALANSGLLTVQ